MNTFGTRLRLTTFGESHGKAIGGVIDGFPSGVAVDLRYMEQCMLRRRPGRCSLTSTRNESDAVEFLSGLSEDNVTLGTPIGFIIRNKDQHPADYDRMRDLYRPNHADYTYICRYGIRDHRGGGRASARETACRVVAGALCNQLLKRLGITVTAYLAAVGDIAASVDPENVTPESVGVSPLLCPDPQASERMATLIADTRRAADSVGGIVGCVIKGLPSGFGDPVYGKLSARLAAAMISINAAKGFEYGDGFRAAAMTGSESADIFRRKEDKIITDSNHSGGIQGGISNGMPVTFRVAFKPTPTICRELPTVDTDGKETVIRMEGRHDPCVAVRAVPVVEAMAAMTVADAILSRTPDINTLRSLL